MPSIDKYSKPIRTKIHNNTELFDLLHTDYSQAFEKWKNGYKIYRGSADIGNYCVLETGKRKSKSITNIYTILLSEILQSWKDYPKRNRSFICVSSDEIARTYTGKTGRIYYTFPINDSQIGICQTYDIWFSFKHLQRLSTYRIHDICGIIPEYVVKLNSCSHYYPSLTKNDIKAIFNTENLPAIYDLFDFINNETKEYKSQIIDKISNNLTLLWFYRLICESNFDIISSLNDILDAKKNEFYHVSISDYLIESNQFRNKREVWCGGKCLFIDTCYFDKLMVEK